MGSRERDDDESPTPHHHHHHLSSMIVRPSDSGGGGSDYEPGEVRPDPPPFSRSDRYSPPPYSSSPPPSVHRNDRMRARSLTPLHHRKADYHYRSDFNNPSGPHRGRGFVGGRGPGRFRDSPPPYGRGRGLGRFPVRDFDGPGFDHGSFRNEGLGRNNPNVAPREGDWICSDSRCGNLNFARRDFCNHCDRPRFGPGGSPRRNYPGPQRLGGPPMVRTPPRGINGYRSPPRGWSRDGPRESGGGVVPLRNGGRFPDNMRRERPDYREDEDFRDKRRFDRPMPRDFGQRDRGRDNLFNGRRGFDVRKERRSLSPPLPPPPPPPPPPPHSRWARDVRERTRSPIRGMALRERTRSPGRGMPLRERTRSPIRGGVGPKDHRRDSFPNRGRGRGGGGRWGIPRGRLDGHQY